MIRVDKEVLELKVREKGKKGQDNTKSFALWS